MHVCVQHTMTIIMIPFLQKAYKTILLLRRSWKKVMILILTDDKIDTKICAKMIFITEYCWSQDHSSVSSAMLSSSPRENEEERYSKEGTTADEPPLRGGMGAGGGTKGRSLMAERDCECLWLCCTEGFSEAGDCSLSESSWTRVSRYFWNRAPCVVG